MRLVILESPYAGPDEADREHKYIYRQLCIRDSIIRGESPYASHQMLTDALNDDFPSERDIGIKAGYEWWRAASAVVFYVDLGWSEGMKAAHRRATGRNIAIEWRQLWHIVPENTHHLATEWEARKCASTIPETLTP